MRRWLDAIPPELFRRRPVLAIGWVASRPASAVTSSGVEARLRDAERWLDDPTDADAPRQGWWSWTPRPSGACPARSRSTAPLLPARRAMSAPRSPTRTGCWMSVDPDDHLGRGGAAGFLGLAYWTTGRSGRCPSVVDRRSGEPGASRPHLRCARLHHRARRHPDRAGPTRRRDAPYEQACGSRHGRRVRHCAASPDMHVGMSEILREWNDLRRRDAAPPGQHRARRARGPGTEPRIAGVSRWPASGRPRETLTAAIDLLDEAEQRLHERLLSECAAHSTRCGPACASRQGRLGDASAWAREEGLSRSMTTSATSASSSTSPSPACSWPGRRRRADAPSRRRRRSSGGSSTPPKQGGRTGAVSSRSCCSRRVAHRDAGDAAVPSASLTGP